MDRRRCCDLSGLDFLEVEGRKVGLLGLRQTFADVAELGLSSDEEIADQLLSLVEVYNWVPEESREAYRKALLREYRRWLAQSAIGRGSSQVQRGGHASSWFSAD